jgi:NitT/TauT family transport system ATP-binding protein
MLGSNDRGQAATAFGAHVHAGQALGGRSLIRVGGLQKTYTARSGNIVALEDITFHIEEGEFITVVGPSGCGKSTLLKILAGLLQPTSGDVRLRDRPVDRPRQDIGVVFQSPVLLPWRTVLANVLLPVQVQHLDRTVSYQRAQDLLRLIGLQEFADKYPYELSGGMQQRVSIARALVHDPAILLMDEPFGALDAMTREYMNLELQNIWQRSGKTVLFITHSIPEAVFLADRVFVMTPRPGRLAEVIAVDLPRPRELDVMNTRPFGEYVGRIRRHFQAKGSIE